VQAQSAALRRLAAQGRLAHLGTGLGSLGPPPPGKGESISEALEEQREERI
jgi:hypothetical protein